jgi:hypothetical protein
MDIEYLIAAAACRLGPQLKDPPSRGTQVCERLVVTHLL